MKRGNEGRFINCYLGVAEAPNVVMKTAYVEGLPRNVLVCLRSISAGEEFLLDYGVEYNTCYITKPAADRKAKADRAASDLAGKPCVAYYILL